jgi:hypothetical protein
MNLSEIETALAISEWIVFRKDRHKIDVTRKVPCRPARISPIVFPKISGHQRHGAAIK